MKLRYAFLFLACMALVAAGCGSDSKDDKDSKSKPQTKEQKAAAKDYKIKEDQVAKAKKAFKKDSKDVGLCRNLAMGYVALASPASSPDPKKPAPLPKDRDESLKKAEDTLEQCQEINAKDADVKQMLASVYMATNKYDKAADMLGDIAKAAKGDERANAYYAWGLAASNAQQYDTAISAWQKFIELTPSNDQRVKQVKASIAALKQAKQQQAKAAASSKDDSSSSDDKKD